MPTNAAGVYTVPSGINPVVAGTPIMDTWANPTLTDVAQGLTDRLDRNGRGSMLAALGLFDGTLAAPGVGFALEPGLGMYRSSAGVITFTVGGAAVGTISATGFSGGGTAFTIPSGTAALPGLAFTVDPDTGVYRPGANILGVSAGGVEQIRITTSGLSVKTALTDAALVVDATAALSTAPALATGTVAAFLRNSSPTLTAGISVISGNLGIAGITFGDTDADLRGFVRYDNETESLAFSAAQQLYRFIGPTGMTAVAQDMSGLEILGGAMNTTGKYTNALKFASTDTQFTTVNPKTGALIVGYATETYSVDTAGGMGMEFWTQNNAPGVAGNLELAFVINEAQQVIAGGAHDVWGWDGSAIEAPLSVGSLSGGQGIHLSNWVASSAGPRTVYQKSRGAAFDNFTIIQDNDVIGQIIFTGSDGTEFVRAAQITVEVDDTPAAGVVPGRIRFYTSRAVTGTTTEALRIDSSGSVIIFAAATGDPSQVVVGTVNDAAHTQWTDTSRDAEMRSVTAGFQFGAVTNHSLAFITNDAIRATISAAGTFSYKTAADGTNTTELASTAFVQNAVAGGAGKTWQAEAVSSGVPEAAVDYPIDVAIAVLFGGASGSATLVVNGLTIQSIANGGNGAMEMSMNANIPAGATWTVSWASITAINVYALKN